MRHPLACLAAAVGLSAASAAAQAQDGQLVFNNACRTCHTTKPGDNRLGPTLASIVGRKAGAESGYNNYSQAMKNSGVIWDAATLDRFIENPDQVVPGNNMKPFSGISNAQERAEIVRFLSGPPGG